jgi:hypothetical protein
MRVLVSRRIVSPADALGQMETPRREALARLPHRREAFRLTGLYFSEEEAREVLRAISEHQWIEAEKAGRDIWREQDPSCPQRAACSDWLERYFEGWRRWRTAQLWREC